MLRTLSKTLTGSVLVLTLALSSLTLTAAPASANNHRNNGSDAAAVLGGLLLLYGLSQAANGHGNVTIRNGHPRNVNPYHPHHNLRVAPARCLIEGRNHGSYYRGYRASCMQRHARAPHLLPHHCIRTVRHNNRQRNIYGGRCLAQNGWVREYGH